MISIHSLLLSSVGVATVLRAVCDGKVMMEYIGATGVPVSFNDVPIDPNIDFYFLLSFAIDADPLGMPQNGKFSPYWAPSLSPDSVQSLKARYPKAKVLASLSGWSIGTKVLSWQQCSTWLDSILGTFIHNCTHVTTESKGFETVCIKQRLILAFESEGVIRKLTKFCFRYKPKSTSTWISNAFSSLKSLATRYHLDGIDIDYETFPKSNDTSFAYCIGQLLTELKQQRVITTASIAPYHRTVGPYADLFQGYGGMIDFINYQFYTDRVQYPAYYLRAFRQRATQFDAKKLLPSYEVDGRGIQGDAFFGALSLIESRGFAVNGVMVFSADASQKDGFYVERKSQEFLMNSSYSKQQQ